METIYIIKEVNGMAVIADTRRVAISDVDFFIMAEPGELCRTIWSESAARICKRYND